MNGDELLPASKDCIYNYCNYNDVTKDRGRRQVIHLGGRMATADGRLTGVDGKLYALASTTCFIFDAP